MSFKGRSCLNFPVALGLCWLATSNQACADTDSVTIARATVFKGTSTYPGMLVTISPAYPSLDGCSNTAGQYVFIDFSSQTAPTGRDLYAAVLGAMLAGHTVKFGTIGCTSDGAYPLVTAVSVDP